MGLREIFDSLTSTFDREKIEYAVVGAFALYGYGYVRATRDLDFATRLSNQGKVRIFLDLLGFTTTHCSTAFSNHVHPLGDIRVDLMYLDGATADEVFASVQAREVFEGRAVPVVAPRHLVAMKLFAAGSNPERRFKDLGDVKEVLRRASVDRDFVLRHIEKNGLGLFSNEILGPS